VSLSFALPGLLWALAAIALPVLLHLVRRERQHKTVFAALEWLDPRQRPRRRLRLRDGLLLALRVALLVALALLLAGLQRDDAPGPARVVLVHPALPAPAGEAPEGERWQWLAAGFPDTTTPAPPGDAALASLLRDLDATLPATTALQVRVPATLDGLDAAALQLSRPVDWQVDDPATITDAPATSAALALAVRGAADAPARRWLRALHVAWQAGADAPVDFDADGDTLPPPGTVLAWLDATAPDAATLDWAARGGTLLLDAAAPWPLEDAPVALDGEGWLQGTGHGAGRVLQWTRPLSPDALPAMLEPRFPSRLRAVLQPPPLPARADARTVAPGVGAAAPLPPPQPLDAPLAWLVLALFALERLVSLWPSRRVAA